MVIMIIGTGAIVLNQVFGAFGHAFEKGDIYNTSLCADGRLVIKLPPLLRYCKVHLN